MVATAVPPTLPVRLPPNIVAVESWLAVAPAAAPLLMVPAAVPSIVPVILPVKVPALSKFFVLSGLLPEFSLVFSVADNLLFTLVCAPVGVSAPIPPVVT